MKSKTIILSMLFAMAAWCGCSEDIDTSARYVFKEYTVTSYLEKHADAYSQYLDVLDHVRISPRSQSTMRQLLSASGHYTVFAPNNQAVSDYLDSLTAKGIIPQPSWDAFPDSSVLDSIRRVIAFNSVIDCGPNIEAYQTGNFPENNGEFAITNMNDRKLSVTRANNPDSIYINQYSLISLKNRDIPAINGVIHQVEAVVAPSNVTLGEKLKMIADQEQAGFVVMARLVMACGLEDTLSQIKDEVYENMYLTGQLKNIGPRNHGGEYGTLPEHRKYGFTIFAETDEFWQNTLGKDVHDITVEDVMSWVEQQGYYPDAVYDNHYTSPTNALNQFVTYHILPMRITKDKLVIHYNEKGYNYQTSRRYTVPVYELYTTMGQRRLIKLYECGDVAGVYINRFPRLDNGRHGNYHETGCDADKEGIRIITDRTDAGEYNFINGIIYPIESPLAYSQDVRNNLQKQRLRFDVAALFPEWMNNDIRACRVDGIEHQFVGMPVTKDYRYLEDLEIGEDTEFYYLLGLGKGWQNWQGDELNVCGPYEMLFRLPPVPARSTYEIRYAVQTNSGLRGMCQVYFGTDRENLSAMGIPLDLRMGGQVRRTAAGNFESIVGWEPDDPSDDDFNAEIDKKMRNNGFMKGPEIYTGTPGGTNTARSMETTTRRIIVRAEMDPNKTYYLRFKSVLEDRNKEFYMDYIELCAKEVYDNPFEPEDIW